MDELIIDCTLNLSIEQTTQAFDQDLQLIKDLDQLEEIRIKYAGRQGLLNSITEEFKKLSTSDKKQVGPVLQAAKQKISAALEDKKNDLVALAHNALLAADEFFDVTAYRPFSGSGSLHPLSIISAKIQAIFSSMGYSIVRGPELESERYNFEALNIPAHHPARDMWDTLWINNSNLLLRTHTSSVQIRSMESLTPPFAIASIGRVYRHEATDATHDYAFHQVEGLLVGPNITMSHLLGTVESFFRLLFENDTLEIRVRPGYFPFVEPGIEFDISCPFCSKGCSICKQSRWIEMGGAGLVHPNVLQFTGIDTSLYSGFAFGMGVSRIAMLSYGINDVRYLTSGNLDFLKQF